MDPDITTTELKMDAADLCREEVFTDRKMGTIRRLIPVTSEGAPDNSRPEMYIGQAQLLTPLGAVPLSFEIDASSLNEAIQKFPDAAKVAVDSTVEELKELRRQSASSIVVPEVGATGLDSPGNLPGTGKIKLP